MAKSKVETITEMLSKYDSEYNKREFLNIVLSTSVLTADYDHLINALCQTESKQDNFMISLFAFSKIELALFAQECFHQSVSNAQFRLERILKSQNANQFDYFISPKNLLEKSNLDVPLCIVSCLLNETLDLNTPHTTNNNISHFFDGFDRKIVHETDRLIIPKFTSIIKRICSPYNDSFSSHITMKPIQYTDKNQLSNEGYIVINGQRYYNKKDVFRSKFGGGESVLYQFNSSSSEIIKIYRRNCSNKVNKINILMKESTAGKLFTCFCVLPKSFVYSNNGSIIGYLMPFIEGDSLETYMYKLSKNPNILLRDIIKVFLKIALAVRSVHLSDIVIADLHYKNFLVTKNEKIKIIDCDSFQIFNHPCEGLHPEMIINKDSKTETLSITDDFHFLIILYCNLLNSLFSNHNQIKEGFEQLLHEYIEYIFDIPGLIYAFYYYLNQGRTNR